MASESSNYISANGNRFTMTADLEAPDFPVTTKDSITGVTYTQDLDTGWFKDADGLFLDKGDAESAKDVLGFNLNSSILNDVDREKYSTLANNINKKESDGGSNAGNTGDKATGVPSEMPVPQGPHKLVRKRYDDLRYPSQAFDTDYMTIRQFKYVPMSTVMQTSNTREMRADRRHKFSIGSVTLPIPSQLVDSNTVGWNNSSLNDLQIRGIRGAGSIMNSGRPLAEAGTQLGNLLTELQQESGAARQALTATLIGSLPGINKSTNELMGRLNGQILNPNLELIFNGPTLRQFAYTFRLTPRNNRETNTVRKIIRFFKQGMAVKETTSMFLSAPNIFQPRFYNRDGNQHTFINTIKKCALTNFGVNYVPDGTYMTLPDSSMTAYDITMQFQEMDPITDSDYSELDNNNDDVIGF